MRRPIALFLPVFLSLVAAAGARAQQPPHAWLFGAWTGGLFPPPPHIPLQLCLAQPVVIFTRDVVLRASLTETTYTQRVVETARTTPERTDFVFSPAKPPETSDLLGVTGAAPPQGFGCETADVLHVQRHSENEIEFTGCADFPYPLVRCGSK